MFDDVSRTILDTLMRSGRTTWAELSQRLGLSAPAVADRVRRLEDSGIIRGYAAIVNPAAIGCGLTAFVQVTLDTPAHRTEFLDCVEHLDDVQECHHVAGKYDYLLKVRCGGTEDLDRVVSGELKAVPGVLRTHTTVVLKTLKESIRLPLTHPAGER